jgi:hypothetical protein
VPSVRTVLARTSLAATGVTVMTGAVFSATTVVTFTASGVTAVIIILSEETFV